MRAACRPPRGKGSVAVRRACSGGWRTPSPWFKSKPERGLDRAGTCSRKSWQEASPMPRHSVHIKVDGRTYAGAYTVDRKVLTVTTSYGKKTAQIGHQVSQDTLAHQLLHELVQEERSRKGSRL